MINAPKFEFNESEPGMPSHKFSRKMTAWVLFLIYVTYALNLLVFGSLYRIHERIRQYNLIPFKTIDLYLFGFDKLNFIIIFNNLLGNVLVFMPLGFFLPMFFARLRKLKWLTFVSFLCTAAVEVTQLIFKVGSFDVDDLILNTLGGVVGYLVFLILEKLIAMMEGQKVEERSESDPDDSPAFVKR